MTKNYCSFSYYTGHNRLAGYYIAMSRNDNSLDLTINIYPFKFLGVPPLEYLAKHESGKYLIGDLLRSFEEVKEYMRRMCKLHNIQMLKGVSDVT